jgi:hypothetical protein
VNHRHVRAWFGVLVIGTAALIGCGGDGEGQGQSEGVGAGSSSTSSGTGAGGAGGGASADRGAPGGSLVSAGHVISSPKYRMVFTVGQSSPVQTTVASPSYTLRGGVIGATGDAK